MNWIRLVFVVMALIFISGCNDDGNREVAIKNVTLFHENYNSGNYEANYKWLIKYSGMTVSLDQYKRDFSYIKSQLGDFQNLDIQNISFDQTTKDGRKLVKFGFNSNFSKGVAKEYFYFGDRNEFYRYELFSDNLLQK